MLGGGAPLAWSLNPADAFGVYAQQPPSFGAPSGMPGAAIGRSAPASVMRFARGFTRFPMWQERAPRAYKYIRTGTLHGSREFEKPSSSTLFTATSS